MKDAGKILDKVLEEIESNRIDREQSREAKKIKFLHHIIRKYNDQKSIYFWIKVIKKVPLEQLQEIEHNIDMLDKEGYPIKTKPGFFISTVKKLGYDIGKDDKNNKK